MVSLDAIDLVIFDKDGTLIDFHAMWSGWVETLADELEASAGRPIRGALFEMMGYDPVARQARARGELISTPMTRLRDLTATVLVRAGLDEDAAEEALRIAWRSPDPVGLAHPLTDLRVLFLGLRAGGRRIAVATSDDREPTTRTLAALGVDGLVDAVVCADDGHAGKPAGDMVRHLCTLLGVDPGRAAVVGDSPADMAMGRAGGAGRLIGVLSGVGGAPDLLEADTIVESVAALLAYLKPFDLSA